MPDESIRPSENPLSVFISSKQDDELSRARALAIETVESYPGMKVWAFEDAPASSEAPRDRYIRNAGSADFVIWLAGSTTSDPVVEEVDACLAAGGRPLTFLLPAQHRDSQTEDLKRRIQKMVTWDDVEDIERLPEHIRTALSDEIARRIRDPVPWNHDLYLDQEHRESIAHTKRLWTIFGVPDEVAESLAKDESIGNRIEAPHSGVVMVKASQGSGKTLAAHRLYQRLLTRRRRDHLQPLPVFIDARSVGGNLKDYIENGVGNQGHVHTQPLLVIIDSLDEIGRHEANQILGQIEPYAEANPNVTAVVMTRPLPGLKDVGNLTALPECSDDEFQAIASKIAGRTINTNEIPYRISSTRNPLFSVIVGTHLRIAGNSLGNTPSQMVNMLVQRILEESDDFPEDTPELLKKLGVASITSGEPVPKSTIDLRESAHQRIARSRLVIEQDGKFDFPLAIFREWFAAKALVERTTTLDDIDLTSDRWVIPLALAINSDTPNLSQEVMETVSAKDPGMAGLVLEEVKHNWSTGEPAESLLSGTAMEIGTSIRDAMENWKEGLGPLMSALGMLDESGSVLTLGIDARPGWVTTSWYGGDKALAPVVQLPKDLRDPYKRHFEDWPSSRGRGIEPTRVWPWTVTHDELSQSLSEQLKAFRLALDSTEGFHEFAYDFASFLRRRYFEARDLQTSTDVIDYIDKWLQKRNGDPWVSVTFGYKEYSFTVPELELFRERVSELSRNGTDILVDPWPVPDKEWPEGRSGVMWFELYTDERLLQRTNAVFNAALRIYNDIVERWFSAFNKRDQMSHALPFQMRGELRLPRDQQRVEWHGATLVYWTERAYGKKDSGVFIELEPKRRTTGDQDGEQRIPYHSGWRILPGNEPRPATKLAHDWLTNDLNALHWARR